MSRLNLVFCMCLALAPAIPAWAQTEQHDHTAKTGAIKAGTVNFETSCKPAVKADFNHAVAELHSFWFPEARAGFEGVLKTDPDCAIAYWGIALTHWGNPFAGLRSPQAIAAGKAAIEKGQSTGSPTPREKGYIDAVAGPVLERRPRHAARARRRLREGDRARWSAARTRTTWRRASSGRSRSRRPRCRPTRRSRRTCGGGDPRAALQEDAESSRGWRTTSSTPTTCRRWPTRRCRRRAPTPTSRRRCRTRSTCRRTRSRASACGRSRSPPTSSPRPRRRRPAASAKRCTRCDYQTYAYLQMAQDTQAKAVLDHAMTAGRRGAGRRCGRRAGANTFALAAIPARYAMERQQWADAAALTPSAGAEHAVHRSDHAFRARHRRGARGQAG